MKRPDEPDRREAFRVDLLRSSLIGDPCRVLLLHVATMSTVTTKDGHPMQPDGLVKVSREEMAEALGIKPKDVSNRIAEAVRVGLLVKESGGRNGQVVVYRAVPRGHAKGTSYTGPASLCAFVKPLVGTTPVVPGEDAESPVGTTGIAPYARAQYSKCDAHPEQAPDGSRAEREDDVTEQAVNYKGWPTPPSKRPSFRPVEGEVAS